MSVDRRSRAADLIREILSETVLREVRDPQVGFVTLTGVKLSPDRRHATVFVSTLSGTDERAASIDALNRAVPFLKRVLATRARLRAIPELRFVEDATLERGSRVESLLGDIERERQEAGLDDDETS
jgi:ribosome-binding factor A